MIALTNLHASLAERGFPIRGHPCRSLKKEYLRPRLRAKQIKCLNDPAFHAEKAYGGEWNQDLYGHFGQLLSNSKLTPSDLNLLLIRLCAEFFWEGNDRRAFANRI
jgi:hypothetical protein